MQVEKLRTQIGFREDEPTLLQAGPESARNIADRANGRYRCSSAAAEQSVMRV